MAVVHHDYTTVNGHRLFYREAGEPDAPVVVLLHGFPTSSHMFRDLVPVLANHYHVIAPDHLGFGLSDAPSADDVDYTFDLFTELTAGLLRNLGVDRYAIYVHDYGAPIGWRLALARPDAITAIISQNGNAYDAGFVESFWKTVWDYHADPTPTTRRRSARIPDLGRHAVAVPHRGRRPDAGGPRRLASRLRVALAARQRRGAVGSCFATMRRNPPLYPRVQAYFRQPRPTAGGLGSR